MINKLKKLNESPDVISLPNLTYNKYGEAIDDDENLSPFFGDEDAHPFWMNPDSFILTLGPQQIYHPDWVRLEKKAFGGRLWVKKKLMSFWSYPNREEFLDLIDKINIELKNFYPDKNWDILNDPKWKVEIMPEDLTDWHGKIGEIHSQLIPLHDYKGSYERSREELKKKHITSPLNKTKEKVIFGFGSRNPKYQDKRIYQKYSTTSESKLVPESLDEMLLENMGTLEREVFIKDRESFFDQKYQESLIKKTGELAGFVYNTPIIRNPQSIEDFPKSARGILTKKGDLFLASNAEIIHPDILKLLKDKSFIQSSISGWSVIEENPDIDFISIQRIWGKPIFAIGESYVLPRFNKPDERSIAFEFFKPFLKAGELKNPQYKFIKETIRKASKNILSPAEYQNFMFDGS